MTSAAVSPMDAVESINRSLSEICDTSSSSDGYSSDTTRRFSDFAKRLQLVLNQCVRSSSPETASVQTALKGISGDLSKSAEAVAVYRRRSRIYVLIHCKELCASLQERTAAIGAWLALLDSALVSNQDLRAKAADLSRDMKRVQFNVTDNEERVYCTLQKEAHVRQTSKAVQSAIIMDLARALGTDCENHAELAEQIRLLKADLAGSSSISERRILLFLEKSLDNWSVKPDIASLCMDHDLDDDDAHIPPFKNFICPLTKEVMKDPVVLESSQTYERTAIQYWFDRCIEDGRDPTCPVTGQILKTLDQKLNIGLAGAIEEWVNRNIDTQIRSAMHCLSEDSSPSVESVERMLDCMYMISEDHPSSRYKVRNAGIVVLIIKLLRKSSKSMGSKVRTKAFLALLSMAKDEESKLIMIEEGIIRASIHSLTASSEKEREYAVKLLLEFSNDEGYSKKIASQKGALVLLSSMAGNLEHPNLSNIAEEALRNMEKVEENVPHLAAAGRFQPLLTRLCEGNEDIKTEMALLVGNMTLTNNGKEYIARHGAKVLVGMLSLKLEGRISSLRALYNLSALDDNVPILVDLGVLPALANILFNEHINDPSNLKELAALTIANLVSKSGTWELASADKEGHSLQSEFIIHSLSRLLPNASPKCQVALLQILCGIMSSPQASESAAIHINTSEVIAIIAQFLGHAEVDHRIHAFRLMSLLSEMLGQVLANELRASNMLPVLKEKLLDSQGTLGERSAAACILANLPIPDAEVKTILGTDLIKWTVSALCEQSGISSVRNHRSTSVMVEGLLGILLHFARSPDPMVQDIVKEHGLMKVFLEQLRFPSKQRIKQRAALGLKYLSESARALTTARSSEYRPSHGFCKSLIFICGKASMVSTCPVHGLACDEDSSFCLFKGQAIKPLADLLSDESTEVRIAAVEALSTLLLDTQNLKHVVDELERFGVVDTVADLFTEARLGELQERTVWMVERFLRVESHAQLFSMNQGLVKALVEAFKHGSANTKRHAQDCLTNLKQLSGVSGKNSSQTQGRRFGSDR